MRKRFIFIFQNKTKNEYNKICFIKLSLLRDRSLSALFVWKLCFSQFHCSNDRFKMSAIEINSPHNVHYSRARERMRQKTSIKLDTLGVWLTHRIIAFEHFSILNRGLNSDGRWARCELVQNMNYGRVFIVMMLFPNNEDKWINYIFDEWFETCSVDCFAQNRNKTCTFNYKNHKFTTSKYKLWSFHQVGQQKWSSKPQIADNISSKQKLTENFFIYHRTDAHKLIRIYFIQKKKKNSKYGMQSLNGKF